MSAALTDAVADSVAQPIAIAERLTQLLAKHSIRTERIADVRRAGSGRSRDNWIFDLVADDGRREALILRVDPDGGLIDTDRAIEFAVLRALEGSGLPTPAPRWLDAHGTTIGKPSLVMRRLPGDCHYRVLRDESRPLEERVELARKFCDLLAAVHQVDWRELGLGDILTDPGSAAARHELDHWAQVLRTDQLEPQPELEYAIAVLGETAPASQSTTLVHADFKPGNILLEGREITALLDWELAHLGDPLEDLGWVTQPLRAGEHTIEKYWSAEDLLNHYELATGVSVDRDAVAWWVVFSSLKTAVMQVSGLRAFVEGRAEEPYRPTRRVLSALLDAVEEF